MKLSIAVVCGAILLSGCTTQNVNSFGSIDQSQKTITVPAGAAGLTGGLKSALQANGWKMTVYRGASVTEGELGESTKLRQYDTFNTRYTLRVRYNQFDTCLKDFKGYSSYDISMIDNTSGTEVFTIDGEDCDTDTIKKFRQLISD
ncbi:hypothetical protein QEM15_003757 [Pseudomonas putida]|nr:hypothetical protein [Pseudomonas putida]